MAQYLQSESEYGIFYDNYVVIDADGVVRYTSVGETFTALGRFNDAHLRSAILGEVTDAAHSGAPQGASLALRMTNPVSPGSRVRIALGSPAPAASQVSLYDARGRLLRRIASPSPAGWRTLEFAADGADGRPLASGVYFVEMRAPGEARRGRVVVASPAAAR
jgi:hypothetical protein